MEKPDDNSIQNKSPTVLTTQRPLLGQRIISAPSGLTMLPGNTAAPGIRVISVTQVPTVNNKGKFVRKIKLL